MGGNHYVKQNNNKTMKARVYRTWGYDKAKEMEFNTLEELLDFIKQKQADNVSVKGVILAYDKSGDVWKVEIYDNYRE